MDAENRRLWTEKIDREIAGCRGILAEDTCRLIAVKSVKGAAEKGAPFGPGPRALLDEVLRMGRNEGFCAVDCGVGVVSLALQEGQPDLGIWLHGDVVPVGPGWLWPPFTGTRFGEDCLIGRGATDNKGQLAAVWNLLLIFRRLGVPLSYNAALYVGSDEESGMHDLTGIPGNPDARGFLNVCTPPRLSLVPDEGFPVAFGGKGSVTVVLKGPKLHGLSLTAGLDDDPGKAEALLGGRSVVTRTPPRHGAHPDPNGNMITRLAEKLLADPETAPADRPVLEFCRRASLDVQGDGFGINVPSRYMTGPAVLLKQIVTEEGCPFLTLRVRYPDSLTAEEVAGRIEGKAAEYGFSLHSAEKGTKPYVIDPASPMVRLLAGIANEVTGEKMEPFIMSGGTYAHRLPNAYVFGMNGSRIPEGFPAGHGGAHGMDELVSLDRLQRAMRIYARALLELDGREW